MEKVNIYQLEIGNKNIFMDYDFSKKHDFNLYDYKLVASFNTDNTDLEHIFYIGNNGDLQKHFKMRSLSVSDIIEINGKKYFVDSFGFEEIKEEIIL